MVVKPFLSALPSARQVRYAFRLVDLSQLSTLSCRKLRTDAGGDLYDAPAALLMHGNEADPVFCYANRTAQRLWLDLERIHPLAVTALGRAASPVLRPEVAYVSVLGSRTLRRRCSDPETRALSLDKPAAQGKNQGMAAVEKQFEGYVTSDPEILGGEPGTGRYEAAADA